MNEIVTNYIGTRILKQVIDPVTKEVIVPFDSQLYTECANWCNNTQLGTIADLPTYYEVVALPQPTPDEKLATAKTQKINEMKSCRNADEQAPIQTSKGLFDFDSISRDRLNCAIIALEISDTTIDWTMADQSVVTVSAYDLKVAIGQAAIRSNMLHGRYRLLKTRVQECETIEEVEQIKWED